MPADDTHGRIRTLPRPEGDKIGVTIWGTEYAMPPAEWRDLAARILAACPSTAAKPKVTRSELRAGMVCRMKKGGIRRIDDPAYGGNGNWVKWTRVDEGRWQGRSGKMWAYSFADGIAEVLTDG